MTRFTTSLAFAALCLIAADANAQVTASSYSNGGTAVASASGRGNTRLSATAIARNGGYASANMNGRGTNGGFASGRSTAIANGGTAISNGTSIANGWGARSHVHSTARSSWGGFAQSGGQAVANGNFSSATANAGATARWGQRSFSAARAVDNRGWVSPQPVYQPSVQPAYQTYGGQTFGGW